MNPSVQKFRERLARPRVVTAPSGEKYTVRVLTAMDYIKEGLSDIPNEFFKFIVAIQNGLSSGLSREEEAKNYELFERYLTVTSAKGIIDPPTTLRWSKEKEDTHILWGEIPVDDQQYLIGCITGRITDGEDQEAEGPKAEGSQAPTVEVPK